MTENLKFLICGNDMRQAEIARSLFNKGYKTSVICTNQKFPKGIKIYDNIKTASKDADCIILPMPCSQDGIKIKGTDFTVKELINSVSYETLVFGGKLCDELIKSGIKTFDYYDREELAVLNAIPTAEGALQIAMETLPVTIHDCKCIVVGYGRIGKIISQYLKNLGANVMVEARKYSDLAWIESNGMKSVNLSDLELFIPQNRLIINTVPSLILNRDMLEKVRKDALIIDLASMPGGVDFEYAAKIGIKTVHALSLPEKVAPVTAGIIVMKTVINMLEEMGV